MNKRILIVDDEPAIADTLDYVLRTDGFEPACVGLGQLALEAVKAADYALVILDIGLPDMSGFDVCRELRRHSNVPVIFLTARYPGPRRARRVRVLGSPSCAKWRRSTGEP